MTYAGAGSHPRGVAQWEEGSLSAYAPSLDFSFVISLPRSKEVWRDDGQVQVDGKVIAADAIVAYRASGSTRDRGRTRGGAIVRGKEPKICLLQFGQLCLGPFYEHELHLPAGTPQGTQGVQRGAY